jgi:hypothetical protein
MVPGAFYGWASHWGNKQYEATLASFLTNNALDSFVYVSRAEPASAQIENQTALNQYYEGLTFFLRIQSEEDLGLVKEALARVGTSARSEQLAEDSNRLLKILAGEAPRTKPTRMGGE